VNRTRCAERLASDAELPGRPIATGLRYGYFPYTDAGVNMQEAPAEKVANSR
jgi:hypothetical protein